MKNLLERMKAEPLAKFNEQLKLYPNTLESVSTDLINNSYIVKLSFGTVACLRSYGIIKNLEDIYDIFND